MEEEGAGGDKGITGGVREVGDGGERRRGSELEG